MRRIGSARVWWRVAAAVVALAVVAGAVAFFVLRSRPEPAVTSDGSKALGTVTGPDASGNRTYDNPRIRFRVRYPDEWSLRESGAAKEAEGQYLTLAFLPKTSSGKLSPPKLEIVPDPQGFSADAVTKMKWGTAETTLTVRTQSIQVAGTKGVEVRASSRPGAKPLYTYEGIAAVPGRLFLLRFETADPAEFEAFAAKAHTVFASLETY